MYSRHYCLLSGSRKENERSLYLDIVTLRCYSLRTYRKSSTQTYKFIIYIYVLHTFLYACMHTYFHICMHGYIHTHIYSTNYEIAQTVVLLICCTYAHIYIHGTDFNIISSLLCNHSSETVSAGT